jgi:hypothetical protein
MKASGYTDFRTKLPFLKLDYTASAKCRYQSHHSMDSHTPKKEHLIKIGIARPARKKPGYTNKRSLNSLKSMAGEARNNGWEPRI